MKRGRGGRGEGGCWMREEKKDKVERPEWRKGRGRGSCVCVKDQLPKDDNDERVRSTVRSIDAEGLDTTSSMLYGTEYYYYV